MKLLQLSKYYPPAPGGIESFVRDLSHAVTAEGHHNLVLAHRFEPSEPDRATGAMGTVVRVPSFGELLYAPIAPAYPLHLRRWLRSFQPDMLLVHMPNVSGFWPLFMSLPCPLVIYWHADVVFPRNKVIHNLAYTGYARFETALLHKASRVIVSSPPYLEHSRPLIPFRHKCEVVPLAIDDERIPDISDSQVAGVKRKLLGDADARYVYAAGRFSHYKGFDRLVDCARSLRTSHPDVRIVIGGSGETWNDIISRIDAAGLNGHVVAPGRIPDEEYWALMKGCDVFCLPSVERSEAFGIVLLEAMAMGKPIVSTAIPGSGTGWVNADGRTGLVVPPDDVPALTEALRTILSPDGPAAEFGSGAANRLANDFSIRQTTRAILGLTGV